MLGKKLIQAASGSAAGGGLGIEDVFSTWLYTGNSSTQTITNGIDLAGEGGMVWMKNRQNAVSHALYDTERGATKFLSSNATTAEITASTSLTSFNSDGFTLGADGAYGYSNFAGYGNYASWTFRKAPGFFDVVTYTGNGSNRTIAHSLGSVPGTIIVKRTDTTADWQVYHRSLSNTEYLVLNSTAAKATGTTRWNSTTPTSSVFSLGTDATVNASGDTYVAYLFAHDEQIFGEGGDQSVIKCGSYTAAYPNSPIVNLGWEPQWLIIKRADNNGNWIIHDTMRGIVTSGDDPFLYANSATPESSVNYVDVTSTGFIIDPTKQGFAAVNPDSTAKYIYIAIRRGPMKTPTSATEVFDADVANDSSLITTGFPVDSFWLNSRVSFSGNTIIASRLTGLGAMTSSSTGQEVGNQFASDVFASNSGFRPNYNASATAINYAFRRAPGFFDVVAYTGTGSARTVSHNLGVAPELMIVKRRDATRQWPVYSSATGNDSLLYLNTTGGKSLQAHWNYTSPTNTVFTVNTDGDVNVSGGTYIAYLFATLPGISKVGSYTGTGTTLDIDCGFTSGARFVLIKRTDSTGDWYVWDTARGIVSGNDPYLLINSTAAEVTSTDYIDPLSSGFQISSTAPTAINASGGSYIYLAIA